METIGKIIIFSGFILIVFGISIYIFGDKISLFGNLYGDFQYKSKNINIFAPITSTILLSVFFSIILNIVLKLFK